MTTAPITGAHRYMTAAHSLGLVHPINGAHRYMTALSWLGASN